jgi:hypothetical protein
MLRTHPRMLGLVLGALALGALAGCSSTPETPGQLKAAKGAAAAAPVVPQAGRVKPVALTPSGGDFNFGGGRRVRGGRSLPLPDEVAEAPEAVEGAPLEPSAEPTTAPGPQGPDGLTADERRRLAALAPGAVASHGIRVTWEALAVERDLVANPRLGRRPQQGVVPDSKIVLVSDDHPAAFGRQKGRASTREKDGSQVAVLAAEDLRLFVKGLREAGFFKVSRPTDALAPLFSDPEARGRVTVEVDGVSRSVLSLRGQGAQADTRDVPRLYSQAKQAVATVRNQTPALSVVTTGGQPVKPRPRLSHDKSRTLTAEEAAKLLGEEAPVAPAEPVDDGWGLGR